MKKITSIISAAACMTALAASSLPANAASSEKVYGTMNIPYADFYSAEIGNAYEVDAVSSATKSKWAMNEPGKLVAGTYNDGNGTILGVTFPVEVNASDVDKLSKYDFKVLDEKPAAYKRVSLSGDALSVSKLVDSNGEQNVDGSATVSTSTRYGDYQLNVKGFPEGADLYGVIVNTKEGDKYALRHLENIWRNGQISWSTGITTKEGHGSELRFEDYASSMGKTATSVTFITLDGYTNVNIGDQYLPVKFKGEIKAEDGTAGTGKTSLTFTGFPDDYRKNITVGEEFEASETEISYTNAKPGKYTVTVSDATGKYAPLSAAFILSSEDIPVKYEDGKLVKADGFSDEDAANFIKNIASLTVNETTYSASGRGSVKIVGEDGTIDFAAKSGENDVFDGSGNYTISVTATGYTSPYNFEIKPEEPVVTTTNTTSAEVTSTTTTVTTDSKSTSAASKTKKSAGNKAESNNVDSPKTGVTGAAVPAAILALAGAAAFVMRRKND
ncbi:MAG: NPXTG-anchored protein [Ruminococcus sp.]|nr:NPXTG-anchored protein [Ruminococcus sp.]